MPGVASRLAILSVVGLWCAGRCTADTVPTFTEDVWPVFQRHCVSCHRPGQIAPMSLLTYGEARPWARSIREMVLTRTMPPWYADAPVGRFSNDARLTPEEIGVIRRWVDGKAPEGEKAMPPGAMPQFTDAWSLGQPDMVLDVPEQTVAPSGQDQFRYVGLKYEFPEDTWIRALEVLPGNRRVVHHANVTVLTTGAQGTATEKTFVHVAVPGNFTLETPPGTAVRIPKGGQLMFEPHYVPTEGVQTDRSRIGLHFASGRITKERRNLEYQSFSFTIPANNPSYFLRGTKAVAEDIEAVQVFCHMHLRGKSFSIVAVKPNGEKEVLLSVPRYNFNWQGTYAFTEPQLLPAGTEVQYVAEYDNSSANRAVLAWDRPDRDVGWGLRTIDEMMAGSVFYTSKQERLDLVVDGKTGHRISAPSPKPPARPRTTK